MKDSKTTKQLYRRCATLWAVSLLLTPGCGTTISAPNLAPTADAGADTTVALGSRVTLDGRASFDPDDDPLTYRWSQRSGPTAELETIANGISQFVVREAGDYEFALTVTDDRGGTDSATTMVFVSAEPGLGCPRADGGTDQTVNEGGTVTLRGAASSDPEGDSLSFEWFQLTGPSVSLQDPFAAEARFRAPQVDEDETLAFELNVIDPSGCSDATEVLVHVRDRDASDPCDAVACEDDGLFCNGDEICLEGQCQSSGNPCAEGLICSEASRSCETATHCEAATCDDGVFCNGFELCSANGECMHGAPPCPPSQYCDEQADLCVECLEDGDCSDSLFCNGEELCSAGECIAGEPPCDNVRCNEETEICKPHCEDETCDDGIYCNGLERCIDGECASGGPPCDADLVCDEASRRCLQPCTDEACDDGVFCNGQEICRGTECVSGIEPCGTEDVCNELKQTCETPCTDEACDDGRFCNGAESCHGNTCAPGQSPCSSHEMCDEATRACRPRRAQIEMLSVRPATELIGGIGPRNHQCTLKNTGNQDVDVPVTITLGPNWGHKTVRVPAGRVVTTTISIPTPPSYGSCGQVNSFAMTARADFEDDDESNNYADTTARIAVPYWDLRFRVVSAPRSARRCKEIGWRIEVKNVGNIPSMNVCAFSGVGALRGAGHWNMNLGLNHFTTPNIGPGRTWYYDVFDYQIACDAFVQTQLIKVEVNYSAGCFDHCNLGNYGERAINIRF